ncbi:hypothetical protein TanjilG_17795 [Lupinus angustifolius]|uniref:RING-CH-type domain-containing protein n=1 Tax=Lupinus angustifolius TaxID=3871 RepID=A0A4P1RT13_LUPAN|nr:PREDICTED: uncharacterized protein LOC109360576 [Lupinus angustifolius]OIW17959.1 hypothetical protein TanjilG_17795 [Lupinus angustifolius]
MDQVRGKGSGEVMDHVDEGVDENLSHLVEGVVTYDAVAGGRLGERDSVSGEDRTSEKMSNDSRLNNDVKEEEGSQEIKVDMCYQNDILHVVDQGSSCNSRNLVRREVLDSCVVIDSSSRVENSNGDSMKLKAKVNESGLGNVSMNAPLGVVSETDKSSSVIDVRCGGYKAFSETSEGEMICRICHLASEQLLEATDTGTTNSATSTDLIQLGCACKDELGIAHSHCAEAWFKLRGNRLCEICGETAKNVSDVTENGFMEELNESRFVDSSTGTSSGGMFGGWLRGQPFCNFLMACLVIAFVMPWFFRVNIF